MSDDTSTPTTETTPEPYQFGSLSDSAHEALIAKAFVDEGGEEETGDASSLDVLEVREGSEDAEGEEGQDAEAEASEDEEVKAEEEVEEEEKKDPEPEKAASKLKMIAREEAKLRKAIAKERADLDTREKRARDYEKYLEEKHRQVEYLANIKELAETDPWEFVQRTGIDMDRVTEGLLSSGKSKTYENDPRIVEQLQRLEQMVSSRFGSIEQAKKAEEEARLQQARQHTLMNEVASLRTFSEQNMEKFPILAADSGGDVEQLTQKLFETKLAFFQAGKQVSSEEAAAYLETELEKHFARVAEVAKKKLTPKEAEATKKPQKTLGKTSKSSASVPTYGKTPEERLARAYQAIGMTPPDFV